MTRVTTIDRLENIISQTTDTYIRHYESEIKCIQEKSNLSLWIIGLSIGIELFVLNKIESKDILSNYNIFLLISTGLFFLINSFLGLIIRIKQTRVYSHFLRIITYYDYQKTQIILNLDNSIKLGEQVISDFSKGTAIDKLKDLEYIDQKKEKYEPISQADILFLHRSENKPSIFLIIQAILTALFLINVI